MSIEMTTDSGVNLSTAPTISVLRREITFFPNLQKSKKLSLYKNKEFVFGN